MGTPSCWGCAHHAPSLLTAPLSLQGTLEGLEEELLAFFSVTPHSVYTALMDNRYCPVGSAVSPLPGRRVLSCAQGCRRHWGQRRPLGQAPGSVWGHSPGLVPVESPREGCMGHPCVGACAISCSPSLVRGRNERREHSEDATLTLSPSPPASRGSCSTRSASTWTSSLPVRASCLFGSGFVVVFPCSLSLSLLSSSTSSSLPPLSPTLCCSSQITPLRGAPAVVTLVPAPVASGDISRASAAPGCCALGVSKPAHAPGVSLLLSLGGLKM